MKNRYIALAALALTATAHAETQADAIAAPLARCSGTLRALADSPAAATSEERSYMRDTARGYATAAAYVWAIEAATKGKQVSLGAAMESIVTPMGDASYRQSNMLLERQDKKFFTDISACIALNDAVVEIVTMLRKDVASRKQP